MEQRYFEQRAMLGGMAPGAGLFDGYRKADALLGKTFFAGLRWDPDILESRCELLVSAYSLTDRKLIGIVIV
ncbi:hypothetical protein QFC21_005072 [Naganishia friedmannii]|uniref:Uncharacterized protein n=1 Tax=Naganishia friedmannii TaxID=89922 RepID=A0ACC2VCK8_9TREE|nr:hypothetical protein QFC21_005072 [Naganishia friedmannii]